MTLAEWNNIQIQEAFKINYRVEYFDATDDLFPSDNELVIFYIDQHAPEFQQEHRDEIDFGENQ